MQNTFQSLKDYADQLGFNLNNELSHDQFTKLFLHVMESYLKKEISFELFFEYIEKLDLVNRAEAPDKIQPGAPKDVRLSPTDVFFTLDETIEQLAEGSYQVMKKHQPTINLIEKTEIAPQDYPYESSLREALLFYKTNKHLIDR